MLLCVVGDVDPDEVKDIALEVLGSGKQEVGRKAPLPEESMVTPEKNTGRVMEVAMPMFNLAFKCEPLGLGDEAIRKEMVADLAAEALFGESSELYLKLYEEGIIDSSFGGGFETIDGCAMLMCSGDSDYPEEVRRAILAQAEKIAAEGEAEYMRILSGAYDDASRADFYTFVRALDAAKISMSGDSKTLILTPDSPLAQIFYNAQ
jgi:predicted Zn-dependent peptidase